ncbi:MAG: putative DNA-binding domain-containing protein [Proteobacteria bacterium]|uniref:HvfC family RiPP maturation protein n=1 Tax=Rudaea sp. TaxID=2136325 RepID=UPI00321F7921|nr:putative DNA-binding domain-containing protein [Pseudomonadota bacterium]
MNAFAPDLSQTQALQYRFTAHLRDPAHAPVPAGIEDRRMGVYRELVYANMESFISSNFPVIRSLYDDADWERLAREFLREHRCHTPLFPEFGREFLRWLETRQEQGRGDPAWLLELAHYEWAELALSLDEADIDALPHDPHGDPLSGVPVMSPLACVLAYRFPVHRIAPDFRPAEAPAEPTLLLLVRGRDDTVRFHEINALSALLVERLQQNTQASGSECLDALLADHDAATAANLRGAGEAMLHELKQREAILGTPL